MIDAPHEPANPANPSDDEVSVHWRLTKNEVMAIHAACALGLLFMAIAHDGIPPEIGEDELGRITARSIQICADTMDRIGEHGWKVMMERNGY